MIISKTKFIEYRRCDTYASLVNEQKQLLNQLDLEDVMALEDQYYKEDLISNLSYKEVTDPQLEIMLPIYNELEMITGKTIENIFGGNVIYDLNTKNQKRFNYEEKDLSLYCFLDGYQEDDKYIRVFETKATTSNKFSLKNFPVTFKENNEKIKTEFFYLENGIYYPLEDKDINLSNSNYYDQEAKLFNIYDDKGKYIYDLAFQRYVYEKSNKIKNKDVRFYLVVLNHEYIYDGKKDLNGENVYSNLLLRFYDLTSLTNKMIPLIDKDLKLVINRLKTNKYDLNKMCDDECPYVKSCYKELEEEYSILEYLDSHHGFKDLEGNKYTVLDLVKNFGYSKMIDLDESLLNRKNNIIQRNSVLNDKPYYNKEKIKKAIATLKYPIYHLDFESFNSPLPRFNGEVPYMQSLFQFSVHIEKTPGVCDKDLDHYSYLMKDHNDNREDLVKQLLSVIKDDEGSVLVYNVAFEKTRLKELSILFPKYKKELNNIIKRLFDLQHIVKNNKKLYLDLGFSEEESSEINYYHPKLHGSYSIKKVLPLFSNLSYDDLVVSNGLEAMQTYIKFPKLPKEEFEIKYQELVEYCKQDTYAMFEILSKLRKI